MNRRAFIAAVGGAASWPLVARGQQSERVRRIGVLMPMAADDKGRGASRRSTKGCCNWAGPRVATCGSTLAGEYR
jgi:hypothetical protein